MDLSPVSENPRPDSWPGNQQSEHEGDEATKLIYTVCICILCNQATGYASQHIWCLFQARINWEGCSRKGIRRKNGG